MEISGEALNKKVAENPWAQQGDDDPTEVFGEAFDQEFPTSAESDVEDTLIPETTPGGPQRPAERGLLDSIAEMEEEAPEPLSPHTPPHPPPVFNAEMEAFLMSLDQVPGVDFRAMASEIVLMDRGLAKEEDPAEWREKARRIEVSEKAFVNALPSYAGKDWNVKREVMRSRKRTRRSLRVPLDTLPGMYVPERNTQPQRKSRMVVRRRYDYRSGQALTYEDFMAMYADKPHEERKKEWRISVRVKDQPKRRWFQNNLWSLAESFRAFSHKYSRLQILDWYLKLPRP